MKWRKVKKQLKKQTIPAMLQMTMVVEGHAIKIEKVRVSPAGGHKINYQITGEPVPISEPKEEGVCGNASWGCSMEGADAARLYKSIFDR